VDERSGFRCSQVLGFGTAHVIGFGTTTLMAAPTVGTPEVKSTCGVGFSQQNNANCTFGNRTEYSVIQQGSAPCISLNNRLPLLRYIEPLCKLKLQKDKSELKALEKEL